MSEDHASLTPIEANLLNVLRSQPGRVFSRQELLASIWPDAVVLERTIDVHVKDLRKKLGERSEWIETVRGVGYCYRGPA